MPNKRTMRKPAPWRHGPTDGGPDGFDYGVKRRGRVVAWTRNHQQARILAASLTMVEMMQDVSNQEFLDLWVAWLGDLSNEGEREGLS